MRAIIVMSTLLVGCFGEPKYDYGGFSSHQYFPIDGTARSWEFYDRDGDLGWQLLAEMTDKSRSGGVQIATIEYAQSDPYKLLYDVRWSSDSSKGIQIHGYGVADGFQWSNVAGSGDTGAGGDTGSAAGDDSAGPGLSSVSLSPPIQFAKYQVTPGDSETTSTGGVTYTSTFEEVENCPNAWNEEWECLRFVLTSDSANPAPFVGTWWLATTYGPSWFLPDGKATPWVLRKTEWDY